MQRSGSCATWLTIRKICGCTRPWHRAKRTGLAAQNRENHPNFRAHLEGKLAYLAMVDRAKGLEMLETLRRLPEA